MPDIDNDFDDEGRGRVMDYVIKKMDQSSAAQTITYGKMATKSAIRGRAYWIYHCLKLDRNCQVNSAMMPSKWVARFHLRE
jgi:DNA polymerase-3 subunit alpha